MGATIEIQDKLTVSSDSTHYKCLNCDSVVENNFCSFCGQKTSTHRFSLQHFFVHDFVHGVFHFDKGFPHTIKELFTRPGHSIREFIQGRRINHFNYFAFILVIIAINHYLGTLSNINRDELYEAKFAGFQKVVKEYYKVVALAGIPLFALTSYLLFRKSRQNYTEHLVLNIYRLSAYLIMSTVLVIISLFYSNMSGLRIMNQGLAVSEIIYSSWFFYQYFSVFGYKKWILLLKSMLTAFILITINNGLIAYAVEEIGLYFFK
ncbi:hypothetical protein ABID42_002853 [Arcicella rosea]|uniref:DUF3667 domain-containing protein n=1 Tax=Arcicella rosea TaxID=502909 RepID=UPI00345DC203